MEPHYNGHLGTVRYRPNAVSGGWSYGRDYVMKTCEGDTPGPGLKHLHHLLNIHKYFNAERYDCCQELMSGEAAKERVTTAYT